MTAGNGFIGATLNGVALRFSVQGPVERMRELKSIQESGPGGVREQLAWNPAGYPVRTFRRSWTFSSQSLKDQADQVERLLASPGPHRWCFWKLTAVYCWVGDGSRLEFFLPHDRIVGDSDVAAAISAPPRPIAEFHPVVRIGESGTPLSFETGDQTEFDAGADTGDALFLDGGARFKLESAPAAGVLVFASLCPYFPVVERGELERRYADNARDPRTLELVESEP